MQWLLYLIIIALILIILILLLYPPNTYITKGLTDEIKTKPIVNYECNSNNHCSPDKYCVNSVCTSKQCNSSIDCKQGHECINGYCQAKSCILNSDCSSFEICHNGICINKDVSCYSDKECMSRGVCRLNRCIWDTEGKSCESRSDCTGLFCVDMKCSGKQGRYGQRCVTTTDCQNGLICYNRICTPVYLMRNV